MKNTAERIEQISKSIVEAETRKDTPKYTLRPWRGSHIVQDIIRLDIDCVRYRLNNYRTKKQQLEYLKRNKDLPKDLFEDPESEQAQKSQEEILLEMISNNKDFVKDLKTRKQVDPIIITYDGFIVNGNRRIAALKSIGERGVDCVVLPSDASSKDIYEIEQEYQISKDFKEPYDWINELLNINDGIVLFDISLDQMAKSLRIEKKEVESRIRMLKLIEQFLDWKDASNSYDDHKISDAEEIFRQLEKALKKADFRGNLDEQVELKQIVFSLIEDRPKEGRLYGHVMGVINNFDEVKARIVSMYKDNLDEDTEADPDDNSDQAEEDIEKPETDLIDEIIDDEESNDGEDKIITNIFESPSNENVSSEDVVNVVEDIKDSYKIKNSKEALFNGVSDSLRKLQSLSVQDISTKLSDTEKMLNQIKVKADDLIEQIKDKGKGNQH